MASSSPKILYIYIACDLRCSAFRRSRHMTLLIPDCTTSTRTPFAWNVLYMPGGII